MGIYSDGHWPPRVPPSFPHDCLRTLRSFIGLVRFPVSLISRSQVEATSDYGYDKHRRKVQIAVSRDLVRYLPWHDRF